jgi:hypothetical protein
LIIGFISAQLYQPDLDDDVEKSTLVNPLTVLQVTEDRTDHNGRVKAGPQHCHDMKQISEGVFHVHTRETTFHFLPWEPIQDSHQRRNVSDQSIQVEIEEKKVIAALKQETGKLKRRIALLEEKLAPSVNAEEGFQWFTSSPKKFYFYTGLSREIFEVLLRFLGPDANNLLMWGPRRIRMDTRFQLALTLMRFRQVYTHSDLSFRFKIGRDTIGNMFATWVQFLFGQFSDLREKMFTPRAFHNPLPKSFRNPLLRNVRVVIDCTEFYIESSSDFKQAGNLYSSYKSRATAKVLIGVAPCGAAMFVSEVFEGAISDREIVKQSGFLDYIKPGDVVLADRGFTIEDLLAEKNATLVIPPFLGGRKEYSNEELLRTKLIAKARIHVERFNERIKNYRIISGVIPHYLVPLLSQIVFILCCIVNFQEPLAK